MDESETRTEAGLRAAGDEELLALHVKGEPDAFGELVRRHRDRLWAVALRTLGDREEAADAVQDALIKAYRAAGTFRGQSAVTTWLHRITVNACLDRARKVAARRSSPIDEDEKLEQLLDPHESAEAPVERGEVQRQLVEALATLPMDQRAALVLVDMQGYPVAEAADSLGVPVGTVKSRCARGRARLLPLLKHLRESTGSTRSTEAASGKDDGDASAPGRSATETGPRSAGKSEGNRFARSSVSSPEDGRATAGGKNTAPAKGGGGRA